MNRISSWTIGLVNSECPHFRLPSTRSLIHNLTNDCRYDRLKPPLAVDGKPNKVYLKVYFYYLRSYEAYSLQFTVYMLLQSRYRDTRLAFDPLLEGIQEVVGTSDLAELLWTPHIFFFNERRSQVMGQDGHDIMVHVKYDGTVLYTKRVQTTLFCWMKLQKFPFDVQNCTLVLESWTYNMTYLVIEWEKESPVHSRDDMTLTEFRLVQDPIPSVKEFDSGYYTAHFQGNYSALVVTFLLRREAGYYVYDYYIPSILLVCVSWVSFWLDPDAIPGRIVLGSSTMLTFMILACQTGDSLPRASYVKASEIWFLVVTAFIFGTLVEFSVANTVLRTPRKYSSGLIPKSKSWPKLSKASERQRSRKLRQNSQEMLKFQVSRRLSLPGHTSSGTFWSGASRRTGPLTSRQAAELIDRRSRILFPAAFAVFNIAYWMCV